MRDIATKLNGTLLSGNIFNDIPGEIENAILNTGQTLASADVEQFVKSLSAYAAGGNFYTDSGSANAYALSPVGSKQATESYEDGQRFIFTPANTNTGASTVNVNSIGNVDILLNGNALVGGELPAGQVVVIVYDASSGDANIESIQGSLFFDGSVVNSNGYMLIAGKYTGKSFSVSSQSTSPRGMRFKDDGLVMYLATNSPGAVYQYSLAAPWDVSTMVYSGVSITPIEDNNPTGLFFKPDGLKMYVVGALINNVHQYSLSTAWDISTFSYDSISLDVSTEAPDPRSLFIKSDGTALYILCSNTGAVYQYTITTAWDLSTASYASKSKSIATEELSASGLSFRSDGMEMYITGTFTDTVYQYSLSTAWDISTANHYGVTLNISDTDTVPRDISFSDGGLSLFVLGDNTDTVYQYRTRILKV